MRKRVLIADPDNGQINRIIAILWETSLFWGKGIEIYAAHTLLEAQEVVAAVEIDILISDIVFQEKMTKPYPGIKWAEKMRKDGKYVSLPIIFITDRTECREYAYQDLNCLGYLSRRFTGEELIPILKKAVSHISPRDGKKMIFPKGKGMIYPIKVEDILYIEVLRRILYIYQVNGEVLEIPHKPIRDFKSEFPNPCLIQCNRSMLLNILYADKLNCRDSYVTLKKDDIQLSVGKKYMTAVERALHPGAEKYKVKNTVLTESI